jgi:NitT/TauT family transport system ATP-binding protein
VNGDTEGQQAAATATSAGIGVHKVSKTFTAREGGKVEALREISFEIPHGTFLSVLGPSGCGKSTLLRLLAGLIPPTSGDMRLEHGTSGRRGADIGFVFQKPVLLPWRTVLSNVLLPGQILGIDGDEHRKRARSLIDMVGLADFAGKYPAELSGGMQQRAAIARALSVDPPTLLMDEPFGALDAMTRESMNLQLQQIHQKAQKTVVFVTHSITEAVFLADQVLVMSARPGRVLTIEDVDLPRPRTPEVMSDDRFGRLTGKLRKMFSAELTGE